MSGKASGPQTILDRNKGGACPTVPEFRLGKKMPQNRDAESSIKIRVRQEKFLSRRIEEANTTSDGVKKPTPILRLPVRARGGGCSRLERKELYREEKLKALDHPKHETRRTNRTRGRRYAPLGRSGKILGWQREQGRKRNTAHEEVRC